MREGVGRTSRSYNVLEYQIPAHHKRRKFANGHVNVNKSGAGAWHARSQLGVGQAGEERGDASDYERNECARTREVANDCARQDVDARAERASDSDRCHVQ